MQGGAGGFVAVLVFAPRGGQASAQAMGTKAAASSPFKAAIRR